MQRLAESQKSPWGKVVGTGGQGNMKDGVILKSLWRKCWWNAAERWRWRARQSESDPPFREVLRRFKINACEKNPNNPSVGTGGARAVISRPEAMATTTQTIDPHRLAHPCRSLFTTSPSSGEVWKIHRKPTHKYSVWYAVHLQAQRCGCGSMQRNFQ